MKVNNNCNSLQQVKYSCKIKMASLSLLLLLLRKSTIRQYFFLHKSHTCLRRTNVSFRKKEIIAKTSWWEKPYPDHFFYVLYSWENLWIVVWWSNGRRFDEYILSFIDTSSVSSMVSIVLRLVSILYLFRKNINILLTE